MKTIGLIGGTSWQSTAIYYRLLNEGVAARLGGVHSARIVMVSLDFAPLADAMAAERWDHVTGVLVGAARQIEAAGADCLALCTNTMHKVAAQLVAATPLPFVDLIDVAGEALARQGARRPLLLATRYTMEQDFYRARLADAFGIEAMVPDAPEREALQRIIFAELCRGVVGAASKAAVLAMVEAAERRGCDAVLLACTEIGLMITQSDLTLPVLDTTALHCDALLEVALASHHTATSQAA